MERLEKDKESKPLTDGEEHDKDSEKNKLVEPEFSDVIVNQPQSINQPPETGRILDTLDDQNQEKELNEKRKNLRDNDGGETIWLCAEACCSCLNECLLGIFFCCNEGCCDCDSCGDCDGCGDCSGCDCGDCSDCSCDCFS